MATMTSSAPMMTHSTSLMPPLAYIRTTICGAAIRQWPGRAGDTVGAHAVFRGEQFGNVSGDAERHHQIGKCKQPEASSVAISTFDE